MSQSCNPSFIFARPYLNIIDTMNELCILAVITFNLVRVELIIVTIFHDILTIGGGHLGEEHGSTLIYI